MATSSKFFHSSKNFYYKYYINYKFDDETMLMVFRDARLSRTPVLGQTPLTGKAGDDKIKALFW